MSCFYTVLVFLLLVNEYNFKLQHDSEVDLPDEEVDENDTLKVKTSSFITKSPHTSEHLTDASRKYDGKIVAKKVEQIRKSTFLVPKPTIQTMKPADLTKSSMQPGSQKATQNVPKLTEQTVLRNEVTESSKKKGKFENSSRVLQLPTMTTDNTKSTLKVEGTTKLNAFRRIKPTTIRPRLSEILSGRRDTSTDVTAESTNTPDEHYTIITSEDPDTTTTTQTPPSTTPSTIPEYPFVVPFIYKRKYPAAPVCGGTIITEKLIITTAYPLAVMPRNYYCALPGYSNLLNVTAAQIEKDCMDIKEVYLDKNWKPPDASNPTPLNLAVIELERTIQFTWRISTGRIPFSTNITRFFTDGSVCSLAAWQYREAIPGPGFPLEEIATQLISRKVIIGVDSNNNHYDIFAEENSMLYLCSANLGMPIICRCTIVGILIPPEHETGYFPCTELEDLMFLPLLIERVQNFLNITIPNTFTPPPDDY